jgi:hypothetical protein
VLVTFYAVVTNTKNKQYFFVGKLTRKMKIIDDNSDGSEIDGLLENSVGWL